MTKFFPAHGTELRDLIAVHCEVFLNARLNHHARVECIRRTASHPAKQAEI
jgi:hypothetical protein